MLQMWPQKCHFTRLPTLFTKSLGKRVRDEPRGALRHTPTYQAPPVYYDQPMFANYPSQPRQEPMIVIATLEQLDNRFFWQVEIAGKIFSALLDPGSQRSYVGPEPAKVLWKSITPSTSYMSMPNGQLCPSEGNINLTLEVDGLKYTGRFMVSKTIRYHIILGVDMLTPMKVVIDLGENLDFGKENSQTIRQFKKLSQSTHTSHCRARGNRNTDRSRESTPAHAPKELATAKMRQAPFSKITATPN